MRVERFTDVARFYDLIAPVLMQHEAQDNFALGTVGRLRNEPPNPEHFFALVLDGNVIAASALMTPPWPLVVPDGSDSAMDALADYVIEQQVNVAEVSGTVVAARRCAERIAARSSRIVETKHAMRIMQVEHVIPPRAGGGTMRVATIDDFDLVQRWMQEFGREIGEVHALPPGRMEQRVRGGEYQLWEDTVPVSIAGCTGPTPNGIRINAVFTPPEFRGRGYASNNVATLTQKQIDSGRRFVFLYTDASNPTSNKIYQQIGYEFVCEWANLKPVSS